MEKILIVQPDLELADYLSVQLQEKGGYESIVTSSIDEALKALSGAEVNVVLADHHIADHSGFELAHEIRKERTSKPEIILMSHDPQISVFEAHQVGVAHILPKPINIEDLMSVVQRVAGDHRLFDRIHVNSSHHGPVKADVHSVSRQNLDVEISNIGRGGFFYRVMTDKELPPIGQIVDFKIKLGMIPHHDFAGRGVVRWLKRTHLETGAGVEFLVIPEESEHLISAFVDLFRVKAFVPAE